MKLTYTGSTKERLDTFLTRSFSDFSRTVLQKFIEKEGVTVNGKKAAIHHWLKDGDTIEGPDPVAPEKRTERTIDEEPEVVDANDHFAVILKPAGLLIHPTERDEDATMASWLRERFPRIADVGDDAKRPGIVHRLDKDVAGLVLVALDQPTFEYFKGLFQEHTITKKYYCLVHGRIQQDEGQIDTPIERNKETGRMVAHSHGSAGKHAVTTFTVIKRFVNYTLLDVQILTGRTHQIRTHLYSIGHSIVGDTLYRTRDVRKKKRPAELERPFLFAYHLSFSDSEGIPHSYTIDLPQPLATFMQQLTLDL